MARWMRDELGVDAVALRDVGLRDGTDEVIFEAAAKARVVVLTKDSDFVELLERRGPPPQVLWLTCGNTSNARLQALLKQHWTHAARLLESGEPLVEISGT
jgi:predicted nuclease of predicted toxin-antitoxin system